MNKRIQELEAQCWGQEPNWTGVDKRVFNSKKFAELIVRECAKSVNDWYQNHDKIHCDPMSYVLADFGVEE